MILNCKKCGVSEIKLNQESKEPTCLKCGMVQELSPFTLKQRIDNKEYFDDSPSSFMFHCKKCNRSVKAVYDAATNKASCASCTLDLEITPFMLNSMKQTLMQTTDAIVDKDSKIDPSGSNWKDILKRE